MAVACFLDTCRWYVLCLFLECFSLRFQILDPSDPSSRSAPQKEEFARFKNEVYQKVLRTVFSSLQHRSHNGDAHICADGITRVLYPGILIESQDAEEAAYFCGCRAASANHPCPKCLILHADLHDITGTFAELRTPETMRAVIALASKAKTKAQREDILKDRGLHNVEHFLWDFRYSDPYRAYSYDTLHSDDLGKWGKHLWVLLIAVLENTTEFSDGQAFYDILKRAIFTYQKCCAEVQEKYGKSFDFLKQHASQHVGQDIKEKGTVDNFSTRIGEGVQQEAAQAFDQTNMKNAEHQMAVIDEKLEAIARIRMAIDNDIQARQIVSEGEADEAVTDNESALSTRQWKFGSPEGKRVNFRALVEDRSKTHREYRDLDQRLRDFIAFHFPEEALSYEDEIFVKRFKTVLLKFQSLEDWTEGRDIMRCNASFHGEPRFDCVIIHDDAPGLSVARLRDLLRCSLPSGEEIDLALVRWFSRSHWKPKTVWSGCRVLNEDVESSLVTMDYVLRGALLCPVSQHKNEKAHYIIDTVDADMFLRENYPTN
ncbi:hypothetical protein EI94DRAFT_1598647 [Lactarius quietus]|nr:hypothetical protein EI94DRAFT_1598647 [Lactarius quietus]